MGVFPEGIVFSRHINNWIKFRPVAVGKLALSERLRRGCMNDIIVCTNCLKKTSGELVKHYYISFFKLENGIIEYVHVFIIITDSWELYILKRRFLLGYSADVPKFFQRTLKMSSNISVFNFFFLKYEFHNCYFEYRFFSAVILKHFLSSHKITLIDSKGFVVIQSWKACEEF